MNNTVTRFYLLILNNKVILMDTNLKHFYSKVIEEDIGLSISLSTLRRKFIENNYFSFPNATGRVYYFQKIENDEKKRLEIVLSKINF